MAQPHKVVLARVPENAPVAADFTLADMDIPVIEEGEILLRVIYLSQDPYVGGVLRGRHMSGPPPRPGGLIPGFSLGEVIETRSDLFSKGNLAIADTGWRTHAAVDAKIARKVDPDWMPLSANLGVGGTPGLTAWASTHHLAEIKSGDHVLVSSAAGPVGRTVGQIARIKGAENVVGIAGSDDKCRLVTEKYGFDECINYKKEGWKNQIKAAFPKGINVYHDNVGAELLDTALLNLANYGRVVLCGLAAQAHVDAKDRPAGPNPGIYILKRAKLMGLVVYDYLYEHESYAAQAGQWIKDGKLTYAEDRAEGLEEAPALFAKLMQGENIGKTVVAVGPETV